MKNLQELAKDPRNSLDRGEHVNGEAYGRLSRHLSRFKFWPSEGSRSRKLWSHQVAAIGLIAAYLSADRKLPIEGITNEAALIKMATGTGKSAVISVICRGLPTIRRALVLTPREALTDQLYRYIRKDFWSTMGFDVGQDPAAFHDDGSRTGAPVPEAYITKLLPSSVGSILHAAGTHERLVLVGTLQALDQIRRTSTKRSNDPAEDAVAIQALDMLNLIRNFDLVIVDEGHYEPAISWSRAIRDADLPTILFSATPYRNDYKSFRVRGRFVFNQPIEEAFDERIIRRPIFRSLDPPIPASGNRQSEVVELKSVSPESEDTARISPLFPRDMADAAQFVQCLVPAVAALPAFAGVDHPKIIVRADDNAKLELLQGEIERVAGARALLIHHAQQRNDDGLLRYNSVKAAYRREQNRAVRYWLHQTKLLEGVDDSSFVAVAIYDVFGNARQLVQQIGRVLRSSDPRRRTSQQAFVMAHPDRVARMEASWNHYYEFERYCAANTRYVVTNEAALPDRLLRDMPEIQYVEGQFRPRFLRDGRLTIDDIRLPASGAVFEFAASRFDKADIRKEITEAILNEDRFQPIEIDGLPDNAVALAYYGWQTSPLLTRQFFPEWTLGVCIVVNDGNLVLAHDTEGIVFDSGKLGMGRMSQTILARAIPISSSAAPVRLSRMSTASLDMSERAIRTQATRTRSFEDTFTDLLDPGMVPTSAYGFIGSRGRYLGFARARIRDTYPEPLSLRRYMEWVRTVTSELREAGRVRNPVFDRYARLAGPLSADDAEAQSILLDLGDSFNDFLYDIDHAGVRHALIDADHDDLCADIVGNEFQVTIDGKPFISEIAFNERTHRYRVKSADLDKHFLAKTVGSRQSAMTFTQILNRAQAFRVIPKMSGIVYANGNFYRPQGFEPRPDGSIPQLHNVVVVPVLASIDTEKGEAFYATDRPVWATRSLFGLMASIAAHPTSTPIPPEWGELGQLAIRFDLIVCDDDNQEVGDFLALDSANKLACIIHAKAAKSAHQDSITGLEAVGRQALASLAFCSTTAVAPKIAEKRWGTDVRANTVTLTGRSRIFKNSHSLALDQIVSAIQDALTNRSWSREIWIVAARLLDRDYVEANVKARMTNRNWQLLMYLDSLTTACARGNTRLRIFCHHAAVAMAPAPPSRRKPVPAKPKKTRRPGKGTAGPP